MYFVPYQYWGTNTGVEILSWDGKRGVARHDIIILFLSLTSYPAPPIPFLLTYSPHLTSCHRQISDPGSYLPFTCTSKLQSYSMVGTIDWMNLRKMNKTCSGLATFPQSCNDFTILRKAELC